MLEDCINLLSCSSRYQKSRMSFTGPKFEVLWGLCSLQRLQEELASLPFLQAPCFPRLMTPPSIFQTSRVASANLSPSVSVAASTFLYPELPSHRDSWDCI